jgi:hypothetical protein
MHKYTEFFPEYRSAGHSALACRFGTMEHKKKVLLTIMEKLVGAA